MVSLVHNQGCSIHMHIYIYASVYMQLKSGKIHIYFFYFESVNLAINLHHAYCIGVFVLVFLPSLLFYQLTAKNVIVG